jgi:putative acetyltransferase
MEIRESDGSDYEKIMEINRAAFRSDEEAKLVSDLFQDQTAMPLLSLVAILNNKAVGHILFTKCRLEPKANVSAVILAPLSVLPAHQRTGLGGSLIRSGLKILENRGIDLVFVLGHPSYYPRFGFKPAKPLGFDPPYPRDDSRMNAWMVLELRSCIIKNTSGKVVCADQLNKPEYW